MANKTNAQAAASKLAAIDDPAARALAATALITEMYDAMQAASGTRDAAVLELRDAGWSFGKIGTALGLSRGRVAQIADAAR